MVLSGKDKGNTGKVLTVYPEKGRALVEGINFVKRHMKKSQKDPQGGIISKESPISVAKLAIFCKACSKTSKVGIAVLADGTKNRFCKKCKEAISA